MQVHGRVSVPSKARFRGGRLRGPVSCGAVQGVRGVRDGCGDTLRFLQGCGDVVPGEGEDDWSVALCRRFRKHCSGDIPFAPPVPRLELGALLGTTHPPEPFSLPGTLLEAATASKPCPTLVRVLGRRDVMFHSLAGCRCGSMSWSGSFWWSTSWSCRCDSTSSGRGERGAQATQAKV